MCNFGQSVFLVISAQHILQSDNGREFTASINTELKELWPELIIGDGRSRHPQSQGSVEISNSSLDPEQYKLGTTKFKFFEDPIHAVHPFMVCPKPGSNRTLKLASVRHPDYNQ